MTKQERMEELKKQLAFLESEPEPKEPESSEDETPQKKPRKTMVKYERTEAQKQSIKKALEVRHENALKRKGERDALEAELKRETEKKLIEKAIKIKKKHIKKEKILEELSDDETTNYKKVEKNFKKVEPKKTFTFFH